MITQITLTTKEEQIRMWTLDKALSTGDYEISNKELLKTAKSFEKYVVKGKT